MDIERVTKWKWKEMTDSRTYVTPDPDRDSNNQNNQPPALVAPAEQEPDLLGSDSEEGEDHF